MSPPLRYNPGGMRLGIVGSAGTGKSTLARNLAAMLGVPLIPDFIPLVLREHGKESWREVRDFRLRRIIRFDAVERKIAAERSAAAFVSDRTVVDYLAYWLHNQAEHEPAEQNAAYVEMVRGHAARYTRCVFLPYREQIDAGAYRNPDPIHNLKIAAGKRGLLSILGVPTIDAPYTFGEDIQAWIDRWIEPARASEVVAGLPGEAALSREAPEPSPVAVELEEAAIVQRILDQARLEFAALLEVKPAEAPRDGEVTNVLDRRIEKLAKALAETEERLRGMISAGAPDPGVASIYKDVQGLASDAPNADRKGDLLKNVFLQSIEVKKRLTEARAARAAEEAKAPPPPAPAEVESATETAF